MPDGSITLNIAERLWKFLFLFLLWLFLSQFISVLMDVDARVRHAAQKLLQVIRLQNMEIFKSSIEGLLKNLELYPQVPCC